MITVLSVNVGKLKTVDLGKRQIQSGIYKKASTERFKIGLEGIATDAIGNLKHHGGRDQALYLYTQTDYEWWSTELGKTLVPGTFGENLTLSDTGPKPLRIGDRFQINDVLLEVSFARIPCSTLAIRMKDPSFVKRFVKARRPGVYLRVLETGSLQVGDPVSRLSNENQHPTVIELYDLWYQNEADPDLWVRALAAPLAARNHASLIAKFTKKGHESDREILNQVS